MSEFFLELFSEEIPASIQKNARDSLLKNFKDFFEKKNIKFNKEFSAYNFEYANTENLFKMFEMFESEAKSLVEKKISLPAYDQCLKASHVFNVLDARGAISVARRAEYIRRIRDITKSVGAVWIDTQI